MSSKSIVATVGPGVGGRWEAHFKEDWGKFVDIVMFFFLNNLMNLPKKNFWTQNLYPIFLRPLNSVLSCSI